QAESAAPVGPALAAAVVKPDAHALRRIGFQVREPVVKGSLDEVTRQRRKAVQPIERFERAAERAQARQHLEDRFLREGIREEHLERASRKLGTLAEAGVKCRKRSRRR